jgi:hypothetical protein
VNITTLILDRIDTKKEDLVYFKKNKLDGMNIFDFFERLERDGKGKWALWIILNILSNPFLFTNWDDVEIKKFTKEVYHNPRYGSLQIVKFNIAKSGHLVATESVLTKLSHSEDCVVLEALAYSISSHCDYIIDKLSTCASPVVRRAVADKGGIYPRVLRMLSNDDHGLVREGIAMNKETPVDILYKLADDQLLSVRVGLVRNPSSSKRLFERLYRGSDDEPGGMAESLAMSHFTPPQILTKLSKSESTSVRIKVASNHNTPIKTLTKLCKDQHPFVVRSVLSNAIYSPELKKENKIKVECYDVSKFDPNCN